MSSFVVDCVQIFLTSSVIKTRNLVPFSHTVCRPACRRSQKLWDAEAPPLWDGDIVDAVEIRYSHTLSRKISSLYVNFSIGRGSRVLGIGTRLSPLETRWEAFLPIVRNKWTNFFRLDIYSVNNWLVLLLSCAKSHMLSASWRQPHLLHVSTVDRRQIWSIVSK